jgi:ABC-type multidrug transport system fused ATPase/permease subunit
MGPSGAGKSTIFQLMMRIYDPDSGTIFLDGIDLKKLDLSWLRGQISYVSQEPLLFSASIRENLLIGKPSSSKE